MTNGAEPVDNYLFEDPELSQYVTQLSWKRARGRVWMTDFKPDFLTGRASLDEVELRSTVMIEIRSVQSEIMKFPFKQTARDLLFFTFKDAASDWVETDTTNAKNALSGAADPPPWG